MVSSIVVSVSVAAAVVFESARAHSWVRCSDYKGVIAGGDYDEDECEGWIRGWEYEGVTFAKDRGINHQVAVGGGQSLCQSSMTSSSATYGYSDTDKIPRYTSGSSVRVVWPAKNHANYDCFDFIPDTAMKLYWNPEVNPSSDLTNGAATMEEQGYELVKDWHDGCSPGTDGCGFQNCPKFCDDTDAATCFGDFVVPDVDTSGYYTFVWHWIFNPGSPYITCWEAYIEGDGDGDDQPDPAPTTTTNPIDPAPTKQPTANPIANGDAIVVINDESTQNWYLSFTMDHIDDCLDEIDAVQLDRGDGVYQDHDQYYYSNGHHYAFFHDGSKFDNLLPISLRIQFLDGTHVDLEDIITDLDRNSVFTASTSCDGGGTAESAFSVDLTAPKQELCQLLLALSVLFNAVMVTIVCCSMRMRSGRGPQKYNAVDFDTETEMEDLEQ